MGPLVSTLVMLGIAQGAILACVLAARDANRLANRILAGLVACVALMMALGAIGRHWGFTGHPHLLGLGAPLPFLFGPLLYLYVVALTRPVDRIDPRWVVHALPFVGDALFMAQVFYLKAPDEKLALARAADGGHGTASYYVVGILGVALALTYLVLAWRALLDYRQKMTGYFSDLAKIDLRWLRALVATHLAIWVLVLVVTLLRWAGHNPIALNATIPIGSSLAIFVTGYISLWQPELRQKATAAKIAEPEAPPEAPPRTKYQRNRLEDDEARELVTKLEALMATDHLYKDAALTLPVLADHLGVTPHTLSQLLNVRIRKSFFVFVNTHRVDALKVALRDPARAERGVLELAFEVGFNSKSTLNSFFKKLTGTTPTAFRKSEMKSEG